MRALWPASIVVIAFLGPVSVVNAQRTIEIIPAAGVYVPMLSFGEASRTSAVGSSKSTFWQTQGVSIGARFRVELSSQSGLELGGHYASSGWREDFKTLTGPGIDVGYSLKGSMLEADIRGTYRPARSNVYGLLGAGFMSRGGPAWGSVLSGVQYNKTNPAAITGLGLRASGSSRFQIDATAELHLYSVDKVSSAQLVNGPFKSNGFQSDLLLTVGFPIALNRR